MTESLSQGRLMGNGSGVKLHGALTPGTWALLASVLVVCLGALPNRAAGQEKCTSRITGSCVWDSLTQRATSTYTVVSGRPALSSLIFPVPQNCIGRFTISSKFLKFCPPQNLDSRGCGKIYGIKSDVELREGTVATFTITYEGVNRSNLATAWVILKSGRYCEKMPVCAVVDCPEFSCVKWSVDASAVEFDVKKPGTFASRLATMTVRSTNVTKVTFESFGNLQSQVVESAFIDAWYATAPGNQAVPPAPFLTPPEFNTKCLSVPGDNVDHQFSIWSKIVVGREDPACEYHDEATIVLTLENHKLWVDEGP